MIRFAGRCGILVACAMSSVNAQVFRSGSDESYGEIHITESTTLAIPPDGIFHATTITIEPSGHLEFEPNELNTPVYLLATGDVFIEGTISVSGQNATAFAGGAGGPGGYGGGHPGAEGTLPGPGFGPGAGLPAVDARETGSGSYGTRFRDERPTDGIVYGGPLLVPMVGGSGGAGRSFTSTPQGNNASWGGGGGGGAILIASDTRIEFSGFGGIRANGGIGIDGSNGRNGGSGGAIRLVAPAVIGPGSLSAAGSSRGGGVGRIRIDTQNRRAMGLNGLGGAGELWTVGSHMVVFLDPMPQLLLTEVAGRTVDNPDQVFRVLLPVDSPTEQTVQVEASNFDGNVPILVVLTPDNGERRVFEATMDNGPGNNPATVEVRVEFLPNVQTTLHVWTR